MASNRLVPSIHEILTLCTDNSVTIEFNDTHSNYPDKHTKASCSKEVNILPTATWKLIKSPILHNKRTLPPTYIKHNKEQQRVRNHDSVMPSTSSSKRLSNHTDTPRLQRSRKRGCTQKLTPYKELDTDSSHDDNDDDYDSTNLLPSPTLTDVKLGEGNKSVLSEMSNYSDACNERKLQLKRNIEDDSDLSDDDLDSINKDKYIPKVQFSIKKKKLKKDLDSKPSTSKTHECSSAIGTDLLTDQYRGEKQASTSSQNSNNLKKRKQKQKKKKVNKTVIDTVSDISDSISDSDDSNVDVKTFTKAVLAKNTPKIYQISSQNNIAEQGVNDRPRLVAKRINQQQLVRFNEPFMTPAAKFETFLLKPTDITELLDYDQIVRIKSYKNSLKSNFYMKNGGIPKYYQLPLFQQVVKERCLFQKRGLESESEIEVKKDRNYAEEVQKNVLSSPTTSFKDEHYLYLTKLLKHSFLQHDYKKLVLSMIWLCFSPKDFPEMLWKIGNFVLKSSQIGQTSLVNFQTIITELLYHKNQPDVLADYTIYLLQNKGDIDEAYQILTEAIAHPKYSDDIYFNILYGQVEYVLWKKACQHKVLSQNSARLRPNVNWGDDEDEDEENDFGMESQGDSTEISFHGNRAMQYLSHIEDRMGIWDCLLPKYCELQEYFYGKEKVNEVLRKHLRNNQNNPKSYRANLSRNTTEEETSLTHLIELSKISPTDTHIEKLILHYRQKGLNVELTELLLKRLRHVQLFKSLFDWQMLLQVLKRDSVTVKALLEEYICNCSSFVKVHFSVPLSTHDKNTEPDVLKVKIDIATLLEIPNYYDFVLTWLQTKEEIVTVEASKQTRQISLSYNYNGNVNTPNNDYLSISSPELVEYESSDEESFESELAVSATPSRRAEKRKRQSDDVTQNKKQKRDDDCYPSNKDNESLFDNKNVSHDANINKMDNSNDTVSSVSSSSDDEDTLNLLRTSGHATF